MRSASEMIEKLKVAMSQWRVALYELAETFSVSFIVIFLIYQFIASIEVVSGGSMEPTFDTYDRILVDKISPYIKKYARGDIVVLIPPTEENKHYIKRVIGMPGDIIKILDCKVYLSNDSGQFVLNEEYISEGNCTIGGTALKEGRSIKLNHNEYVVLGDNREHSIDSRFFGLVTPKNILGRVIFRFWPIGKVGFI